MEDDDCETLARKVVDLFKKESFNIYYIAPVRAKDSATGKSIASKGKIPIKYRNIRQARSKYTRPSSSQEKNDPPNANGEIYYNT